MGKPGRALIKLVLLTIAAHCRANRATTPRPGADSRSHKPVSGPHACAGTSFAPIRVTAGGEEDQGRYCTELHREAHRAATGGGHSVTARKRSKNRYAFATFGELTPFDVRQVSDWIVRPERLFALRAHPCGAALRAVQSPAAIDRAGW